jgi:YD repeat-containing protein
MRRIAALLLLLALPVFAQDAGTGEPKPPAKPTPRGQRRFLTYRMPGAYRFVERLDLTDEQKSALDRIAADWMAERRSAQTKTMNEMGKLGPEARKDPEKVRAHYAKLRERLEEMRPEPPVDLVEDVLTEEQRKTIGEAGKVTAEWTQWLAGAIEANNRKLDKVLGARDEATGDPMRYRYHAYGQLLAARWRLASRLQLTDAQAAALESLYKEYSSESRMVMTSALRDARSDGIPSAEASQIGSMVRVRMRNALLEKYRARAQDLLTSDQRSALDEAERIAKERDEAVWERYQQYMAALSSVLPGPEEKAPKAPTDPTPPNDKPE